MKKLFFFSLLKSLLFLLLWKRTGFLPLIFGNLGLTVLIAGTLFKRKSDNQQRPLFILLEIWAPVFSTFLLFVHLGFGFFFRKFSEKEDDFDHRLPFGEAHYQRFLEERRDEIKVGHLRDDGERKLHESFQIEPFLDIIEGGDVDLKINAIGKLSAVPAKSSIALLKLAMNDETYEVRYFAANSLSHLEHQLIGHIEVLGQTISRFPQDHKNYSQRGLAYLNMYYLGIIDSGSAGIFLERALNDFLYSLQIDPGQNYLYVKILEVHTHRKDYDQILELRPLLAEMDFPETEQVKIDFYVAEALFESGEYDELVGIARRIEASPMKAPLMVEALEFWSGSGP